MYFKGINLGILCKKLLSKARVLLKKIAKDKTEI
jgi:exonuclease VII small subunit